MLKKNGWDYIEDVLSAPLGIAIWVGIHIIAIAHFVFAGGWLDVIPGKKGGCDEALSRISKA